jgi:hypothetical protein
MERMFQLCLVGMRQNTEWIQLVRGGKSKLQSGENNNTFNHLEENGNELKLTDFQEKSI